MGNDVYLNVCMYVYIRVFLCVYMCISIITDGAKLVRDAFDLAKEKIEKEGRKGAIIFIDELDAIGTKRYGGEQSGDREVGGYIHVGVDV